MIRLLIAMIMVPMTVVAGFAFSPGTKRPQCPVTPSATMSRTIATITKQSFLLLPEDSPVKQIQEGQVINIVLEFSRSRATCIGEAKESLG